MASLDEARELGLSRYETGKPCCNGHIAERFVCSRQCVVCAGIRKNEWAAKNKSRIAEYNSTYLVENRSAIYATRKVRHKENPEMLKASKARYYKRHRAQHLAKMKRWRESNIERVRQAHQRKRLENPEAYRTYKRNYKARKRNAPGSHNRNDIADIFRLQRGKCAICRFKLKSGYHVDHIVPLSKGGANDRRNLQITCGHCNVTKHAADPIEFMQSRGMLL